MAENFNFNDFDPGEPVTLAEGVAFSNKQQTFVTVPAKSNMERGDTILMVGLDMNWRDLPDDMKIQDITKVIMSLIDSLHVMMQDGVPKQDEVWVDRNFETLEFFRRQVKHMDDDIQKEREAAIDMAEEKLEEKVQEAKEKYAVEAEEEVLEG